MLLVRVNVRHILAWSNHKARKRN